MESFMNYDFAITALELSCFVHAGTGRTDHQNRPNHGLALFLDNSEIYTFSTGTKLSVQAGEIIYLPKHSTYTTTNFGNCYAINFRLDTEVPFPPFVVKARNQGTAEDLFRMVNKAWLRKDKGYLMKCKAGLYQILSMIQQDYYTSYFPKHKLNIILPALEFIHENYDKQKLQIEELSQKCGITPEYFRRIFKNCYGVSPLRYINNLRITRAKELLTSGLYTVTDAAFLSGYSDICQFSREFKKSTGTSPSEYQKQGRF